MMYNNKLVASIRANGKILREFKDTVYIPFGSEYSILLKNLNTVRALINLYIDGDNVVPGGLVLNAGQEIDQQRAIRNNNLNEGNKFKFIERTGNIEQHRGVKLEDGLIRVEYQFEKIFKRQDGIQWNNIKLGGQPYYGDPTWTVNNAVLRGSSADVTPSYMKGTVSCADFSYTSDSMVMGSAALSASAASMQRKRFNAPVIFTLCSCYIAPRVLYHHRAKGSR